jgi:hypothetical protein
MAYGDFVTQVGEEVGIARTSRYGGFVSHRFGTVTKINGHGHIFVQSGEQELRFTRAGNAYKSDYGPSLMDADKLRAQLAVADRRKEQRRIAQEIEQAIKSGYSYSGTFHVSEERVAILKELVNQLEMLVDKA